MSHPYIRLQHRSPSPCPNCAQHFNTEDKTQKYCSVACKTQAMRVTTARVCVKCKKMLPHEAFPLRGPSGNRPKSCVQCYTPRARRKPAPMHPAPNPCAYCKKQYSLRRPPSAMKQRRYCSAECAYEGMRVQQRTCQVCARLLPYDAFAYEPSAKGRRRTCERCSQERARLKEQGLGFMQSAGRMKLNAKSAASRSKLPYTIADEDLLGLHGAPCGLCGKPSCIAHRVFPELGFISGNVEGRCWLCGQLGTTRTGVLTDEVILKHARAIVAHADS